MTLQKDMDNYLKLQSLKTYLHKKSIELSKKLPEGIERYTNEIPPCIPKFLENDIESWLDG